MTITALLRRARSERGSLPMVLVVVIVGMALTALMVPIVLVQTSSTAFESTRGKALRAAQSGIDSVLGQLRTGAATCGPMTGQANDQSGSYHVTIDYYAVDPRDPGATPLLNYCGAGAGLSSYVVITSKGTDGPRSRTLQVTYSAATTYRETTGGWIRIWPSSSGVNFCLTTDNTEGPNKTINLAQCENNGTPGRPIPRQAFVYNADQSIRHVESALCLARNTAAGANPANAVILTACHKSGEFAVSDQRWFYNAANIMDGRLALGSTTGNHCMAVAALSPGSAVTTRTCSGQWGNQQQSWLLSPDVGAGYAESPVSGRIFNPYGRCLDEQSVNGQEIVQPCGHTADPTISRQKWTISAPNGSGLVQIKSHSNRCLLGPAGGGSGAATLGACDGAHSWWAVYTTVTHIGGGLEDASHAHLKFTIHPEGDVDRCLTETRNDNQMNRVFRGTVTGCVTSESNAMLLAQKWNVPLHPPATGLVDLHEIASGPVDGG